MAAEIRTIATSGNTVVRAAPGTVYGYALRNTTAQTDNVVTVYDNTTATGTKILFSRTLGNAENTGLVLFPQGIKFTVGVSVGIAGTTPNTVGQILVD